MVWRRDDVSPLSTSSQAGAEVAYTVVATPIAGLALLVFDLADGHTLNSYPLPLADRLPGRGVGRPRPPRGGRHQRGQVYGFAPA